MGRKSRETGRRRRGAGAFFGRFVARLVEMLVCLGVIGAAGYGFYSFAGETDYFHVKWIQVDGTKVLSEDAVVEASGITEKSNIFFLRSGAIRKRIEMVPYVQECRVTTVFPDTVDIHITERDAVATVLIQHRLFSVDRDGRLLREQSLDEPRIGPLVTELPITESVEVGEKLESPSLAEAVKVWEAFAATDLAGELSVSEIAAPHESDIQMICDEVPYPILWGRGDYTEQAARLRTLWKAKGGKLECTQYLDLRFGRDLICK